MRTDFRIALAVALALAAAPAAVIGHNGEYVPPETMRPPRPVGPATGAPPVRQPGFPVPTPGRPAVPTRPGEGTPRVTPGPPDATGPESIARERALSWETVWALLGDAEPGLPPPVPASAREEIRAALVRALADEDADVRWFAGLALGRGGFAADLAAGLEADPVLAGSFALLGAGLAARRAAADGDQTAAGHCRERIRIVLEHPDASAEARALAALAGAFAGWDLAGPLLRAAVGEGDGALRTVFHYALGRTGHPGAAELLLPGVRPPPEDAIEPDEPTARALLVSALGSAPTPETEAELVRRLGDRSSRVAAAAAMALRGVAGRPSVRMALVDIARNGTPRRRSAALLALTLSGDPESAALARAATADPLGRGNGLAAFGVLLLGLLRSSTDGEALAVAVGDRSLPADVRAACALAVGLVRARDGEEALARHLPGLREEKVRAYALLSLALLGGERAVPRLEAELRVRKGPGARRVLMDALGRAGGEKARQLLEAGLGDDYAVNRRAARALFRLDPVRAADAALTRLADGENPFARRFGAIVLGRALDPDVPSVFADALFAAALDRSSPALSLLTFLESERLFRE